MSFENLARNIYIRSGQPAGDVYSMSYDDTIKWALFEVERLEEIVREYKIKEALLIPDKGASVMSFEKEIERLHNRVNEAGDALRKRDAEIEFLRESIGGLVDKAIDTLQSKETFNDPT